MKNNLITNILLGLLIVIGIILVSVRKEAVAPSNFGIAAEPDIATTTDYRWPTLHTTGKQLKTGYGVLSSVCIGNTTAVGTLTLYDATTTVNGDIYGTTTLAVINTGTPGQCLPYNVTFSKGLLAIQSATLATSTITTK